MAAPINRRSAVTRVMSLPCARAQNIGRDPIADLCLGGRDVRWLRKAKAWLAANPAGGPGTTELAELVDALVDALTEALDFVLCLRRVFGVMPEPIHSWIEAAQASDRSPPGHAVASRPAAPHGPPANPVALPDLRVSTVLAA